MSVEEKVDKLLVDFSEHRGEMKQFSSNMTNYVDAVNKKLDKHLDNHHSDFWSKQTIISSLVVGLLGIGVALVGMYGK